MSEENSPQLGSWKNSESRNRGDTRKLTALFAGDLKLIDLVFSDQYIERELTLAETEFVDKLQTLIVAAHKTMIERLKEQAPDMPESSKAFKIFDTTSNTTHQLPNFDSLLLQYADSAFYITAQELIDAMRSAIISNHSLQQQSLDVATTALGDRHQEWAKLNSEAWKIERCTTELTRIVESIEEAKATYKNFSEVVVPELRVCVQKANQLAENDLHQNTYQGECFLGHGADALYWAINASRWQTKLAELTRPVKVNIGRGFLEEDKPKFYSSTLDEKYREPIVRLIKQLGVRANSRFIDTGFFGSVPAALIRALDPEANIVPLGEENRHIALMQVNPYGKTKGLLRLTINLMQKLNLTSLIGIDGNQGFTYGRDTKGITSLGSPTPEGKSIIKGAIDGEYVKRFAKSPNSMVSGVTKDGVEWDRTNRIPTSASERVIAYAAQQAVIREFLPRSASRLGEPIQLKERFSQLIKKIRGSFLGLQ